MEDKYKAKKNEDPNNQYWKNRLAAAIKDVGEDIAAERISGDTAKEQALRVENGKYEI